MTYIHFSSGLYTSTATASLLEHTRGRELARDAALDVPRAVAVNNSYDRTIRTST